ncbi:MAG: thiamine-binding protein [Balneolaceae bacterium]
MKTIAELTFIPLYTEHPKEKVQELLEVVAQYDVEVEVGYLSTTINGDTDKVLDLIREVYEEMSLEGEAFRFHIELLSPTKE